MRIRRSIIGLVLAFITFSIFLGCDNSNIPYVYPEDEPEQEFKVTFVTNGGSPVPAQQTVSWDNKVTMPPFITKDGFGFIGWYKEAGYTNLWNFAIDTVTSDITLHARWVVPVNVPGASLIDKLTWLISNAQSDSYYVVEVDANESIGPQSISYPGRKNVNVFLKGFGSVPIIISLSANGSMFTIESGVTLILDDMLELRGRSSNTNSLILVNSGATLILNNGTKITGNTASFFFSWYDDAAGGGGVGIYNGTFTMNGGEISDNTTLVYGGGGVGIYNGTFTMNGGKISGNTSPDNPYGYFGGGSGVRIGGGTFTMNEGEISGNTSDNGSGVYCYVGTFNMNSGVISGNTASSYGGGVSSVTGGIFTMKGGVISGNTAGYYGGGVYVERSVFNKIGGTIFGYSLGDSNSNAVKIGGVVQPNTRGHAIHVSYDISYDPPLLCIMGKDTTSGPGYNLSFNGSTNPPTWSGDWDY